MTFTSEFIDIAIVDHIRWIEKIKCICDNFEVPVAWRQNIISVESELSNLLNHLKLEIFDEQSIYHDIKYELSYVKEISVRMINHVSVILLLIEISNRKQLNAQLKESIVHVTSVIRDEVFDMSNDVVQRLNRWKELSL